MITLENLERLEAIVVLAALFLPWSLSWTIHLWRKR